VSSAQPSDGSPAPIPVSPASIAARPRRIALFAAVAGLALAADLISKSLVVANLRNGHTVRLLGGALYLLQTRNSGAAWSVGTGATIVLTVVAVIVVIVILRVSRRMRSIGWAVALGLILGGALGNLIDRIFRTPGSGRGHVVDWISVFSSDGHIWPVFNLADSAIVCGAVTAAIVAMLGIDIDGSRKQ
jgi:signal peptidase II